jgi:serine phosphatase RsbU (regulator of sigma subunit)
MQLQAEMQWNLLPPLNFACREVAVSGLLEPAYHIGGDAFDYALNGDVLHFAIFDSMGHDLTASLLTSLVVATYRNCRREGVDLATTLETIDAAIVDQFDGKWVTLQLGELDTRSGTCRWVNAGHPLPLLVQEHTLAGELGCPPTFPAGLGARADHIAESKLDPGDLLLFYTDGTVEARRPDGEQFGEERLQRLLVEHVRDGLLPGEILRRLLRAVVDHQGDHLRDDATVMLLAMPETG